MTGTLELQTPAKSSAESGSAWDEVVRLTAAAFQHRSEGREWMALRILKDMLPLAVRTWRVDCGVSESECRGCLRSMFARVHQQVSIVSIHRRILAAGPRDALPSPLVSPAGRIFLKHEPGIGAAPAVAEALEAAEAECAGDGRESRIPKKLCVVGNGGGPAM